MHKKLPSSYHNYTSKPYLQICLIHGVKHIDSHVS